MKVRIALVCLLIAGIGGLAEGNAQRPGSASTARVTPAKPVPSTLREARTIFLINETPGPAADAELRDLQAQLRQWNRFRIVDRADLADLTMSLATSEIERTRIAGGAPVGARLANPRTSVVRTTVSTLTVRQRSSGEILWAGGNEPAGAVIRRLQQEMPLGPALCVVVWCW